MPGSATASTLSVGPERKPRRARCTTGVQAADLVADIGTRGSCAQFRASTAIGAKRIRAIESLLSVAVRYEDSQFSEFVFTGGSQPPVGRQQSITERGPEPDRGHRMDTTESEVWTATGGCLLRMTSRVYT